MRAVCEQRDSVPGGFWGAGWVGSWVDVAGKELRQEQLVQATVRRLQGLRSHPCLISSFRVRGQWPGRRVAASLFSWT